LKVSGCELLARTLVTAGVLFVTGKEEGALGPTFKALQVEKDVTTVTPMGDIAGAFMAYGNTYYNFFPAVILASTPGEVVNAVTGVGTAWGDKIPVFLISAYPDSRVAAELPGHTQRKVFSPFTKWSREVSRWEDIPGAVGQAGREAQSGCHSPIHLDICESVLAEERDISSEELDEMLTMEVGEIPNITIEGDPDLVAKGLKMLLAAERPLIVAGGGVVHAQAEAEMDALVKALEIPASTSMAGEGSVLGDNPYYIGGPSYVGGESFHRAIKRADCVLVVGAALGGLEGFGQPPLWNPDIRFIQVDIDPVRICLNIPVEVSILGDAGAVLRQMLDLVNTGEVKPNPAHRPWLEHLLEVKRRWWARVDGEADDSWPIIHQGYLAKTIKRLAGPEAFLVIDGGNTALWAGTFCMQHKPKSGVFPAGMGTLGCGIPVAIGIKAADPDRPLVVAQGDGSFLYNVQELELARRLGMEFVVVIFNDGCWNMIKGAQDMMFGGRNVGGIIGDVDYGAVARGMGCFGKRVTTADELEPAFKEAVSSGLPAVLDVIVDPDTFPEQLASFAVGEFGGIRISALRALGKPKMKLDRRLLNRAKYAINIMLDRDLA
jgi:acetolactate synthase-1/2/3 large subunit